MERKHPRGDRGCYSIRQLIGVGGAAGLVLLQGSCLVALDRNSDQCSVDGDCRALGGAYVNASCQGGVCVAPSGGGGTGGTAGSGGGTGAECTTNEECITAAEGRPAICAGEDSDKRCVELLTEDCTSVVPENLLANDNTIVVGFMGALKGEYESLGVPMNRGFELALREIQTNANGLPGGEGGKRRPLAMLSCHDLDDPSRVAEHLIENVRVPAILGPLFSGVTISTATDIAVPNNVLLLSPSATSPAISDLQDNGLVWRTAPSDAFQAVPLSRLVAEAEQKVRADLGLEPTDTIRVAISVKGDAYGQGLADAVQGVLQFNGKSVVANGKDFRRENYADTSSDPNFDFSGVVSSLVEFKPHIIMPLGTNEGVTKVMLGVEGAWPTSGTIPPRPYYLFPDGGRVDELLAATKDNANLRVRVRGTVPGRKGPNYDSFKLRYRGQFDNADPGTYSENAYDGAYLLAYSIVHAGTDVPLTGTTLANSLKSMSEGMLVTVGPTDLNKAMNTLAAGAAIDFDGASGPLDFDNSLGEAPADIDLWCVVEDQTGEAVFLSSGRYYEASSGNIVGTEVGCD